MVVHDEHLVELALGVSLHHIAGQLGRLSELGVGRISREGEHRLDASVGEVPDGLLATGSHLHLGTFPLLFLRELLHIAKHVGVEAAGETPVGGDGYDEHPLHLVVDLQQRLVIQVSVLCRADEHV